MRKLCKKKCLMLLQQRRYGTQKKYQIMNSRSLCTQVDTESNNHQMEK